MKCYNLITRLRFTFYLWAVILMKKIFSAFLTLIFVTSMVYFCSFNVFGANSVGKVNCTSLNVRAGAGTSYSKIATLNNGAQVTITGSAKDSAGDSWYKISFTSSGSTKTGYAFAEYITVINSDNSSTSNTSPTDASFEKYMTDQGFPDSYKPMLRELHKKYPKWIFKAQKLNVDWNTALAQECVVGRNLVHSGALASWKSMEKGAYNFNGGYWYGLDGGWVAASKEIIAYYLDPRNFINDPSIFMFENLSYNSSVHTINGVKNILSNSFMKGNFVAPDTKKTYSYAQTFMDAAKKSGVSPYHLASRCLNEQGVNGAPQSLGTVAGYKNYFNFFDINAYATSNMTAQQMGCKYATTTNPTYLLPWTNQYKSIVGGSIFLGSGYINKEQDTLYLQKFDMVDGGNGLYYHQYMTCVFGQENEAAFMKRAYSKEMLNSAMEFKIPIYKNMPTKLYTKPTSAGDNNNFLKSLSVSGKKLTQTFDKYTMSYSLTTDVKDPTITVNAAKLSNNAKVVGSGKVNLKVGSNKVNVKVTAPSGVVRTYTTTINRTADNSIPRVSDFKSSVTSDSVKLSWTKVSNADGYIIYKYDDNKKTWVRINKTTTNGTSYTVSKLTSGTKYKFAIKAYKTVDKKEIASASYPQVEAITKVPAVTNFKSAPALTSVKLTWTKVSNADGYIIYKYDDNKKTWVRINKTTTNGTSYTVSKLTSGTKYKFAIKAYKTVDKKEIASASYPQVEVSTQKTNIQIIG